MIKKLYFLLHVGELFQLQRALHLLDLHMREAPLPPPPSKRLILNKLPVQLQEPGPSDPPLASPGSANPAGAAGTLRGRERVQEGLQGV
jgi:hypothetical protein